MYVVLVGPSGKCRKGTAMNQGMTFMREAGIKMAAESITREALIRELKEANKEIAVDVASGDIALHASLTVYSQELTVFLGYNNQALMSDLTDWYDCRDEWTYRTKTQGTDAIIGVWVNLIGATTPDLLQTTLPQDAIGGGLTSRIIFVYEQEKGRTVATPFLSREERELQQKLKDDLHKICAMSGDFKVTNSFIDSYVPWYVAYSEGPPPFKDYRFSGYFERRPSHLLKLSMICCASRSNKMELDAVDFNRALDILERTEKKMPYTFSGVGKSVTADSMARVMKIVAVSKEIDFSELHRRTFQDIDKFTLEKLIESLISMDYVEVKYIGQVKMIIYKGKEIY